MPMNCRKESVRKLRRNNNDRRRVEKVDEALASVWSPCVHLKIDGYKVSLNLTQKSRFQNVIMVYINDEFRGKWLMEDCEERRRFCYCKRQSVVTEKIANFTEFVTRKLSKSSKRSLAMMCIYHIGQTLRK